MSMLFNYVLLILVLMIRSDRSDFSIHSCGRGKFIENIMKVVLTKKKLKKKGKHSYKWNFVIFPPIFDYEVNVGKFAENIVTYHFRTKHSSWLFTCHIVGWSLVQSFMKKKMFSQNQSIKIPNIGRKSIIYKWNFFFASSVKQKGSFANIDKTLRC